jgi:hypothetical protein
MTRTMTRMAAARETCGKSLGWRRLGWGEVTRMAAEQGSDSDSDGGSAGAGGVTQMMAVRKVARMAVTMGK